MERNRTVAVSSDIFDLLERVQSHLQGLAVLIEERAYGLEALGVSTEGFDMDADNIISAILREDAKAIDAFIDGENETERGESRE